MDIQAKLTSIAYGGDSGKGKKTENGTTGTGDNGYYNENDTTGDVNGYYNNNGGGRYNQYNGNNSGGSGWNNGGGRYNQYNGNNRGGGGWSNGDEGGQYNRNKTRRGGGGRCSWNDEQNANGGGAYHESNNGVEENGGYDESTVTENGGHTEATTADSSTKPSYKASSHSIKVPRLYKEAAKALKKVEEEGEGLKTVIHSMKHPNVKALTALVSEALKHTSQLEVLITKSKLLKKEVGLAKQTHLVKILLTELLWGKKRLGGESKPVVTITSYKEKFDKVLKKLENETGEEGTASEETTFKKPRYARVNTLKMELSDAIAYLLSEEWNQVSWDYVCELGQYDFTVDNFVDNLLVFPPGTEFHNHPLYLNGSLVLQDKASCLAAMALKPRKGRNVIDACAAPGMKTSHLAALTHNESPITAVEKSTKRFETLKTIVDSLGATEVTSINQNFTDLNPEDYPDVEYILVDPSCSGSGMYSRLEIQLQSKEKNMERILKLQYYQLKVLRHAMKFPSIKRIVYSTCSINPEENEDVIAEALHWINNPSSKDEEGLAGITWTFKLKRALPDWPHRVENENYEWSDMCVRADESDLTDGFFVAVLEREK